MTDATICHSMGGPTMFVDAIGEQTGCLVQIYPVDGASGMWNLDADEVYLGRGTECDVQIDDDAASRRHAAIELDGDDYILVDLNSTNGTYINNKPVKQHRLVAGDRIRIGTHVLKYLSSDHIELQYHETVFRMTTRDGLTQAYNRRYMDEFLDREIARSLDKCHPLTVALIDIDHFKSVNDTHGHLAGDEVLRELCSRAPQGLRGGDLFARYGGEEFCAVFWECGGDEAKRLGEQIRGLVADEVFETVAGPLEITASIGLASWDGRESVTAEQLLAAADKQLYDAKESGRDRVKWTAYENA